MKLPRAPQSVGDDAYCLQSGDRHCHITAVAGGL